MIKVSSYRVTTLFILLLTSGGVIGEELSKEINYISDDGVETKSEIICVNNQSAFIYENNDSKEIRLERNWTIEYLGKVTIDEVIKDICV